MKLEFGIEGIPLVAGDHLCALYLGSEDRDAVLIPYAAAGLAAGHRVCLLGPAEGPGLGAPLLGGAPARRPPGQLTVGTVADGCLAGGPSSVADVLDPWPEVLDAALDDGYTHVRGAVDASCLLDRRPSGDAVTGYEAAVGRFVAGRPVSILCLWDLRRLSSPLVAALLRTHRRVVLGGLAVDSPHFVEPDVQEATRRRRSWIDLSEGQREIARLAATGLSATEISWQAARREPEVARQLLVIYRALAVTSRPELTRVVAALEADR